MKTLYTSQKSIQSTALPWLYQATPNTSLRTRLDSPILTSRATPSVHETQYLLIDTQSSEPEGLLYGGRIKAQSGGNAFKVIYIYTQSLTSFHGP